MRASEILASWGIEDAWSEILDDDPDTLERMNAKDARKFLDISGEFSDSCSFILDSSQNISDTKKSRVSILDHAREVDDVEICMTARGDGLKINVGGSNNKVFTGRFGQQFRADINMWHSSIMIVSDRVTCNYARIVLDCSTVFIGYDSMISDDVLIQSADQHGIVDIDEMSIINHIHRRVRIGKHVWIGRRSIIMPDCEIADGAIVGAGAIVTSDIEKCSIAAGVPARIVNRNKSWSRQVGKISPAEIAMLRKFKNGP